ncbi:Putative ribosomal protein L22 (fragment) [Elizabethkingia anophelis]
MYLKIKTESYTTDLLNIIIDKYIFLNITKKIVVQLKSLLYHCITTKIVIKRKLNNHYMTKY